MAPILLIFALSEKTNIRVNMELVSMLKKILLASCLLLTSMASQAALISYNGYERDSTSNIVKGGGLEWLMWDVTKGRSINDVQNDTSLNGWAIATNQQMANLFNVFLFGAAGWSNNAALQQDNLVSWEPNEHNSVHSMFIKLFGVTGYSACGVQINWCYLNSDPFEFSEAIYGDAVNGKYNQAAVADDAKYHMSGGQTWTNPHIARLDREYNNAQYSNQYVGVALTRVAVQSNPTVNTPSSISMLVLSLIALGVYRRQASLR